MEFKGLWGSAVKNDTEGRPGLVLDNFQSHPSRPKSFPSLPVPSLPIPALPRPGRPRAARRRGLCPCGARGLPAACPYPGPSPRRRRPPPPRGPPSAAPLTAAPRRSCWGTMAAAAGAGAAGPSRKLVPEAERGRAGSCLRSAEGRRGVRGAGGARRGAGGRGRARARRAGRGGEGRGAHHAEGRGEPPRPGSRCTAPAAPAAAASGKVGAAPAGAARLEGLGGARGAAGPGVGSGAPGPPAAFSWGKEAPGLGWRRLRGPCGRNARLAPAPAHLSPGSAAPACAPLASPAAVRCGWHRRCSPGGGGVWPEGKELCTPEVFS